MQLLCDQEHTDGAVLRRAAGVGSGSGGRGDPAALGGTVELHRMGHYAWDSSGGGVRVCARTGLLVGVCVRACVRETVCARTFMSVFLQFCSSWSSHRLWTSHFLKDWRAGRMEKRKKKANKWVALIANSIHSRCFVLSFQENWNNKNQHCISPPFFPTTHNIGMKIPKQRSPREGLILNEHAQNVKLDRYLQQKQHSHNIPRLL